MASQQFDNSDGRLRGRALQARRLRIWSAHPHCARCGRLTDYPQGFQLDHRIPLFKGGEDKEENLQVLCIQCHDTKTNEDLGRTEKVHIGVDGWPRSGGGFV